MRDLRCVTHFEEDSRFKSVRLRMRGDEDEGAAVLLNGGDYIAVSLA